MSAIASVVGSTFGGGKVKTPNIGAAPPPTPTISGQALAARDRMRGSQARGFEETILNGGGLGAAPTPTQLAGGASGGGILSGVPKPGPASNLGG